MLAYSFDKMLGGNLCAGYALIGQTSRVELCSQLLHCALVKKTLEEPQCTTMTAVHLKLMFHHCTACLKSNPLNGDREPTNRSAGSTTHFLLEDIHGSWVTWLHIKLILSTSIFFMLLALRGLYVSVNVVVIKVIQIYKGSTWEEGEGGSP